MAKQVFIRTAFNGGISSGSKRGLQNSARFTRFLDIWTDEDAVSLLPRPEKVSGSTVVGLIKYMVDGYPYVEDKYGYDDTGRIYKITSAGVWSVDRTVSISGQYTARGQGLAILEDSMYYASAAAIGRKRYLSGAGTYDDDFLSNGTDNLDTSGNGTGNTYTVPVAVSEAAADKLSYTPTKDPLKSVLIKVVTKGTGNLVVTLHDANNNILGTVTKANADFATGDNTFTFSSQIRVTIGAVYHFHVTSTVADTTVDVGTASNFSTAYHRTYFYPLIEDTEFHPMILHNDGVRPILVIGNKNYLAVYDQLTYDPNAIALEPGYRVRGFTRDGQDVVAYCTKGSELSSYEEGKAFWWDGIETSFTDSKPITSGQPNTMINFKNRIFSVLGSRGIISIGTDPFRRIQSMPHLQKGKKVEVLPAASCVWDDRVLVGVAETDDPNFEQGIYEFGTDTDRNIVLNQVATEVLNYAYRISTGNRLGTDKSIGCMFPAGDYLYVSWKDGTDYGVDRIAKNGNPETYGSWESPIIDLGMMGGQLTPMPQKTKAANKLIVTFEALPEGCTVTPKYRMERADEWTFGTAATEGDTRAEFLINSVGAKRYKEIEVGYDLAGTVNFPQITGIYFEFDPLENEDMSS